MECLVHRQAHSEHSRNVAFLPPFPPNYFTLSIAQTTGWRYNIKLTQFSLQTPLGFEGKEAEQSHGWLQGAQLLRAILGRSEATIRQCCHALCLKSTVSLYLPNCQRLQPWAHETPALAPRLLDVTCASTVSGTQGCLDKNLHVFKVLFLPAALPRWQNSVSVDYHHNTNGSKI